MVLDFCRARLLVAPPCSCCLVSRSHLLDVLPVVAQVLENNIALHRTASALICIVTAVPNLVYGCPLALRAALSLSLCHARKMQCSHLSVCRLPVPGRCKRSVPLRTLLSSGSLSHVRLSVG